FEGGDKDGDAFNIAMKLPESSDVFLETGPFLVLNQPPEASALHRKQIADGLHRAVDAAATRLGKILQGTFKNPECRLRISEVEETKHVFEVTGRVLDPEHAPLIHMHLDRINFDDVPISAGVVVEDNGLSHCIRNFTEIVQQLGLSV